MSQFLDLADDHCVVSQPEPGRDWLEPLSGLEFVWLDMLGIWFGKHMVTNEQWRRFRPEHDSGAFRGCSLDGPRQPVVRVSFDDAMAFADWLTQDARERDSLPRGAVIRVPSSHEWTVCARCGDGREFPWGNQWPPVWGNYSDAAAKRAFPEWEAIADYDDGYAVTCPVDVAGVNDWGIVGLGGNAYEWTFEADGTETELRGGSFSTNHQDYLRIADRYRREPSSRLINFGVRLVLVPGR